MKKKEGMVMKIKEKIKQKTVVAAMSFLLMACGSVETQSPLEEEESNNSSNNSEYSPYINSDSLYLRGSVSSGFDITVDGINYQDSESYYTEQIDKLEQEKIFEGYEGYTLTFDAEVGLTDLKNGMTVFAEAMGNEGYASETIIVADGTFKMEFPQDAGGDYKIRANKRIGVILSNGIETIYWCWNFSANDQMTLRPDSRPIILKQFETRLTKYQCKGRKSNSLSIPKNPSMVVVNDQPAQQAQIDHWNDQWEEEVVGNLDEHKITQEQIDVWNQEWEEEVMGVEVDVDVDVDAEMDL